MADRALTSPAPVRRRYTEAVLSQVSVGDENGTTDHVRYVRYRVWGTASFAQARSTTGFRSIRSTSSCRASKVTRMYGPAARCKRD